MINYYIQGQTDKWVRPAGWLTMPTITAADNKMAFLFAVYENRENSFSIQYASNLCNYTMNWGDGTSLNVVNSNTAKEKRYLYSSITSPVLQDANGTNYKQVVITMTWTSGTITLWTILSQSALVRTGPAQILETIISWPFSVSFNGGKVAYPLMQSLIIKKLIPNGTTSSHFANLFALRNFEGFENIDASLSTTSTSTFINIGPINQVLDLNWYVGGAGATTIFQTSLFRKFGNVTVSSTGSGGLTSAFSLCYMLEEVGIVNVTGNRILTSMFNGCINLRKIGKITCNDVTTITGMFQNCYSLEDVEFTSVATVTTPNATTFSNCQNLKRCVLPGLTLAMSVTGCNLGRDAILELCSSLGNAATSQALTLTGNPGLLTTTAAEINAILTPKNWTYIG